MSIKLQEYTEIPDGFLNCNATELNQLLSGPSLIHLQGKHPQPLFVSIVQHGNEAAGLYAVQMLLKAYQNEILPRSISIFVANVSAAEVAARRLPQQPDYNRMWLTEDSNCELPEAKLMQKVMQIMKQKQPFASIDIHSNTGLNPHYACINKLDNQFFHLALLFSKTVVYFLQPDSVQSIAFSKMCPSVTLECGQINDESGVIHAFEYLDACLQLHEITESPVKKSDMDLFHTVATVTVPEQFSFSFSDNTQDIYFEPEIEIYNFKEIPAGTLIALSHPDKKAFLNVFDESKENVWQQYLEFSNNEFRLKKSLMPSMITTDEKIIRQDCLCYLMERHPF